MTQGFDYEMLAACQYQVEHKSNEFDCGEPAIARGWWFGEDGKMQSEIYLCADHLKFILLKED